MIVLFICKHFAVVIWLDNEYPENEFRYISFSLQYILYIVFKRNYNLQDLAIRCIQRNFRVFLKVKDWPWWRLLVRITPLLDVNRTDEQLKVALSDIQILKQKLEKSDTERSFLKNENEKLECKVSSLRLSKNVQFMKTV